MFFIRIHCRVHRYQRWQLVSHTQKWCERTIAETLTACWERYANAHTHNNQIILPNSEITVLRLRHFPPGFFFAPLFFPLFRFADNFPLSTLLRCQVYLCTHRWQRQQRQPLLYSFIFICTTRFMCWLRLVVQTTQCNLRMHLIFTFFAALLNSVAHHLAFVLYAAETHT